MLTYKFYKTDGNLTFYHYFPQGNGDAGIISIDRETGKITIVKSSNDDFGNRFAFKLINRLKEFFEDKDYKQEGKIVWY